MFKFGTKSVGGKLLAVGVVVGGMIAGGIAYSAWNSGGTGSATSQAQSAQDLTTVDVSATTPATLYPGATGDASISISNPNSYPVRVTDVAASGAIVSDQGAACDASTGVTFTDQGSLTLDVPAGDTATFTLAGAVSMSNASDNDCQGAVFTIPVTLTGASNAS